jgi:hypothetical protein
VGRNEPQIWLRVLHVAGNEASGPSETGCREQVVEIALGPKVAGGTESLGVVTRRVAAGRAVSASPASRRAPKPPRAPRTPRVTELLRKALKWQALLESGAVASQAEIARREGVTRARVTQVMALLRLTPEVQKSILAMPRGTERPGLTERGLRRVARAEDPKNQLAQFRSLSPALPA